MEWRFNAVVKGLFVGRFQPLHRGHVEVIRWILNRVDEVVVAIGSSNESYTPRNPFTAGERIEMVHAVLRELNALDRAMVCTVPDTGGDSAIWYALLRRSCPRFNIAFTNDEFTRLCLEAWGVKVEPTPLFDRKRLSGTVIRALMARGDPSWRGLVTGSVLSILDEIGAEDRVRRILAAGTHQSNVKA